MTWRTLLCSVVIQKCIILNSYYTERYVTLRLKHRVSNKNMKSVRVTIPEASFRNIEEIKNCNKT